MNPVQANVPTPSISLLEARFPHIVQGLLESWFDPEVADHFLKRVLVDDRGDRHGLPPEAFEELMFLSELNWKRRHFNDNGVQVSPDVFRFGPP
jgi:hypothetical protein